MTSGGHPYSRRTVLSWAQASSLDSWATCLGPQSSRYDMRVRQQRCCMAAAVTLGTSTSRSCCRYTSPLQAARSVLVTYHCSTESRVSPVKALSAVCREQHGLLRFKLPQTASELRGVSDATASKASQAWRWPFHALPESD